MGRCFKPEARRHSADALAEMGEATLGFTDAKGAENHHRRNAGVRPHPAHGLLRRISLCLAMKEVFRFQSRMDNLLKAHI